MGKEVCIMQTIRIERTTAPKEKPGQDNPLVFGTIFTDHMFVMDYDEAQGWHDAVMRKTAGMTRESSPISRWYWNLPVWYSITDRRCSRA